MKERTKELSWALVGVWMSEGELERTQVDQVGTDALVAEERRRRWKAENGEAIAQHNAWIEEHGLPLAEHRSF